MSERKQTPDVLGDILGTGIGFAGTEPASGESLRAATRRRPASRKSAEPEKAGNKTHHWEYLVVSCQEYRGWRPRFEGGVEIPDWTRGRLLTGYLEERGRMGWELVAASSGKPMFGATDCFQLFFKKPVE